MSLWTAARTGKPLVNHNEQLGTPLMYVLSVGVLIIGVVAEYLVQTTLNDGGGSRSSISLAAVTRGKIAYERYCASCHGNELQGQADWKSPLPNGRLPAPPHDASGHTWHHPDVVLSGIIRRGLKPYVSEGYESDMPAFEGILAEEQIGDILSFIKSTWPARERDYQRQMTDRTPEDPAIPAASE
jgi:mono/diheme cytochrome c family protein